ncbi:thioesterase domain-containing protein [Nocardia camponoti]|uniref:Carrier domain-containing protein n=1 Tax=Nocardia camponoti TaxID=1616106 RepID=A0A917VD92_9NOCA|nr:alpha/beta fold hydrolase [Nocardia camponoti]GGK63240.1 hypothetical protein GCM10011591_39380 [Nocardia camponoti]
MDELRPEPCQLVQTVTVTLADAPTPPKVATVPTSALEQSLIDIWTEVLGLQQVGVNDNFFDLGGTSRAAAEMLSLLEKHFSCSLPMNVVAEAGTITELANRLRASGRITDGALGLVRLSSMTSRRNFFCVHGLGGHALVFARLARTLADEMSFYAFESMNRYIDEQLLSVEDMAERYLREVRRIQPRGPYHLGGYSMGGLVALEMAHRLRRSGEQVGLVALIDTDLVQIRTPVHPRAVDFVSRALGVSPPVSMPIEDIEDAAELIRRRLSEQIGRPTHLSVDQIRRFAYAYVHNQSAISSYQIRQLYDGEVYLFYSTLGPHEAAQERREILQLTGWANASWADRLHVVPIESDHWTILSDNVDALAVQLRHAIAGD